MFSKKFFNISDFARISGVSRQTLIYYDRIGLFSPAYIAENKYRMYAYNQIDTISTITILSDLGVSLKEIKNFLANMSPQKTIEILKYQLNEINEKITKLSNLRDMTQTRLEQIELGNSVRGALPCFSVVEIKEPVPFYVGKELNCNQATIGDDNIIEFFESTEKSNIPLIFSFGYLKRVQDVLTGNFGVVERICFRLKNEKYCNEFMPSGKYIVGYCKGDYGKTNYIYKDLLNFALENGLTPTGEIFEEYLIDELAEKNADEFIMQTSVKIR